MENNIYLTDEERAIIVDFVSCAVGEGYSGDRSYKDIEEKLNIIAKKLGFSRNDIGVEHAICRHSFVKNGIEVKEGDRCYYNEESESVSIITKDKLCLELTREEAHCYFG